MQSSFRFALPSHHTTLVFAASWSEWLGCLNASVNSYGHYFPTKFQKLFEKTFVYFFHMRDTGVLDCIEIL